jgi:chaperonin GroES
MSDLKISDRRRGPADEALVPARSPHDNFIDIASAPQRAEALIDSENHGLKADAAIVPIGDRLIVRKISPNTKTYSGLILPDLGQQEAGYGVVVACGQGRYNIVGQLIPLRIDPGAVICFGKYAGTKLALLGFGNQDGECVSLREEEVFFVVTTKAEAERVAARARPPIAIAAAPEGMEPVA